MKCPYCGANPYKDSVPCTNEEMAKECQRLSINLKKVWEEGES